MSGSVIDISPLAVDWSTRLRDNAWCDAVPRQDVIERTDIPQRTDHRGARSTDRQNRHVLFGEQEGKCRGCRWSFERQDVRG